MALAPFFKMNSLLWGLNNNQINEIQKSGQVSPSANFFSIGKGYLQELLVSEGQYVETGTPLFQLADLNAVWVETQVYANEVIFFQQHPNINITFEAYPNTVFTGKLAFANPVIEENRKINLVRFIVENQNKEIRPGMMAYVQLKRNRHKALTIPKTAIILESGVTSVWVETQAGMYEKKMIFTGIDDRTNVEVLSGIDKGEKVVSSGAYLINSEFILKNGANAMGGMKM